MLMDSRSSQSALVDPLLVVCVVLLLYLALNFPIHV